ncbi:hypothetical protein Leryth_027277, partial [Lithospermum erythrorhizon]
MGFSPSKMFTLWVYQGLIPVDAVIHKKGVQLAAKCVCCSDLETIEHVFFSNGIVAKVWDGLASLLGFHHTPFTNDQSVITAWTLSVKTTGHIRQIVPIVTLWALWETRNRRKHLLAPDFNKLYSSQRRRSHRRRPSQQRRIQSVN